MGVLRQPVGSLGRCIAAVVIGLTVVMPVAQAQPTILFDNFGPGDSTSGFGQPITGSFAPTFFDLAIPFSTDSSTYLLNTVMVPIVPGGPPPSNSFLLQIRTDNGGVPSDTILASLTTSEIVPPGASIVWNPLGVLLSPDQTYWLAAAAATELTNRSWLFNNQGQAGLAVNQNGSGWVYAPQPATPVARIIGVRLQAAAAAEPGTLALIGLGTVGKRLIARRRKSPLSTQLN